MPFPERLVEPVSVSRGTLQVPVPDELEGVTNGSLANIIRQLSSLSKHAEEMFGNLFSEAESIAHRSSNLQARIDRIAIRVTQLDSTVEEVSLQDIHLRKAFRSTQGFDQQVVSRDTMPKAMLEAYLACDTPPPLSKLNPYREDGKDGLKFYTDPTYFFELWRQEMLKDTERMMHDRGKKNPAKQGSGSSGNGGSGEKAERNKKRVRQPGSTADRQRAKVVGQGEYIMQNLVGQTNDYDPYGHHKYQPPPPPEDDFMNAHPSLYPASRQFYQLEQHPQPRQQQVIDRPNTIELGNSYGASAMPPPAPAFQYNPSQEPIYTPRILRSEQPSSPRHQPQQMQNDPSGVPTAQTYQFNHQNDIGEQRHLQQQSGGSAAGTPTRRPNQPPPAPPSPIRLTEGSNRDSLPPPPPPPAVSELQSLSFNSSASQPPPPMPALSSVTTSPSKMNSAHQSSPIRHQLTTVLNNRLSQNQTSESTAGASIADLPPPPPVPTVTGNHLEPRVPTDFLPPSPPPPPPAGATSTGSTIPPPAPAPPPIPTTNGFQGAPAPPPPPPPPPGALTNGNASNGEILRKSGSPAKTNGGSQAKSGNSILSPPQLKKPTPAPVQGPLGSDLLKAIRDGINLRKVENKKGDDKGTGGTSDVASILARRVAVEMSDSDNGGHSDSEYDSDDWGDESTA